MRLIYSFTIVLMLSACSSEPSFCDCIDAGEKVNQLSASFFNRDYSVQGKDSLDAAVEKRDEICAPFSALHPFELQDLKDECDQLKITLPEAKNEQK